MTPLAWIRCKLFGSKIPERETIVAQIEHETARLNGAVKGLEREVVVIKRSRMEINKMTDDTLQAMQKEFRR